MEDILKLVQAVKEGGIIATLVICFGLFVLGLYRKWIVFGHHYQEVVQQRDSAIRDKEHLIQLALQGTALAETWSSVAKERLR